MKGFARGLIIVAAVVAVASPPADVAHAERAAHEHGGGQEPSPTEPPRLRLVDVLATAHARNPEIRAARSRATAAAEVPRRVAALDDPTFSWEAWDFPESFAIDQAENNILKLSQKLPFPGKRRLTGDAAKQEAVMAARDVDGVMLDVATAVKRAFADLWQAHENARLYARDQALVERLTRATSDLYATGQSSQPDVLRAQVELTRVVTRTTTAKLAVDVARAELNALLDEPPGAPLAMPEDPAASTMPGDVETLTTLALEHRPELASQRAAVAREETNLARARLDYLPDFEVTAERFFNNDRRDGFGGMLSLSLPIVQKGKYDAAVRETVARLDAARADERRVEDRIRREVAQAYLRTATAREQHGLYQTSHIPLAEQSLAATESAYQTAQADLTAVIESVRTIEDIHLEHAAFAAEFEKAYADLERAVGTDLPRTAPPQQATATTATRRRAAAAAIPTSARPVNGTDGVAR